MPDAASARVRTWYPLKDPAGRDLVSSEIVDVILGDGVEPVTQTEKELRYAEVKRTLRQASDGQLSDGSWKPVSRDPELWELRWQWDDGSQLRGYFHEPPLEPDSTGQSPPQADHPGRRSRDQATTECFHRRSRDPDQKWQAPSMGSRRQQSPRLTPPI